MFSGGFGLSAGVAVRSMAPFPAPPHRTVHADFPHTALGVGLAAGLRGRPGAAGRQTIQPVWVV